MLSYDGKPLEQLNYQECLEYEKQLLKKILAADRSGMSGPVIDQLKSYHEYVKMRKSEALMAERPASKASEVLNIGEIESEQTDDTDTE